MLAYASHSIVTEKKKHANASVKKKALFFCHNIEGHLLYLGVVSYDPHDA